MAPSAHARFRMISVVTDRLRARARMLHMMKRFPGTPRRKTMPRMMAPRTNESVGTKFSLGEDELVVLFTIIRDACGGRKQSTFDLML